MRRPCATNLEPFASRHDEGTSALAPNGGEVLRAAGELKLAAAAFMEGYHVPQTHPQLMTRAAERNRVHPVIETSLHHYAHPGPGMGGDHENDVRIAEGLQHLTAR